jgi:hypothetical protein
MTNEDEQSAHYGTRNVGASAVAVIWSFAYCLMLGGLLYHPMQTVLSNTLAFLIEQ